LNFGLAWDFKADSPVDLDLAAVAYSSIGVIEDAAYFNQTVALDGGIRHSGDCKDGTTSQTGSDEVITVDFSVLPLYVDLIVFVASGYNKASFGAIQSATIKLETKLPDLQKDIPLHSVGTKSSLVVAMLSREYDTTGTFQWNLRPIEAPCDGCNFYECQKMMQVYVDEKIGYEMVRERGNISTTGDRSFSLHKAEAVGIPEEMDLIRIGLGWTDVVDDNLDMDASVVMVDRHRSRCGQVFF
jgi:stress response protein SCP2